MDTIVSSSNQPALFSQDIYLTIKSNTNTDEKRRNVHVTVDFKTRNSIQPELIIKLTDELDPFFLYELHLHADDFENLKQQQRVLIDFNEFPQHVIKYLNNCIRDQHTDITPSNGTRFQLQLANDEKDLRNDQSHLRVVEISTFKHLTHFSLLVTSANDHEIKNYLAKRLQTKIANYNQLNNDYEKLKKELESTQIELKEKNTDFEKLKLEWDSNNNQIIGRHMRELAEEKEKALEERTNLQQKIENERRELEQTHSRNIRDIQKRLSELEETTKELTTLKYRNEITINELTSKLSTLTEEYQQAKDEIIKYRKTNTTLENDIHQHEKTVNHLRTKLALVEQEVKSKQEVIHQTNDRIVLEQESKKKYEETLQLKMEKIIELKRDVDKGNEIIAKINDDLEKCKSELRRRQKEDAKYAEKMKTKDQIATKQERILQEKERELAILQKDKIDLTNKLEKSNDSYQKLTEQNNEAKELLKKNEALINYLNHKLTELQNLQPQQGRLLNGNMTLDSSSTTTTTNHFRPSSFLTNSQTNGEPHSMRHVAQFPSLQTHYEPMNKSQGTTWNSSTTGHHQHMMSSTQMPISSSTLNTGTSNVVRHHSASNGDLKDNTEQNSLNPPMSSKIDPKYFQFNSTSGTNITTGIQPLRSSMSAGNVQNSTRANTTTTSTITNKPLSAQQNRSARQYSVNTTPLASAYSSEKQM